ncbi:MAG: flippase [Lachnospiraceae bacterium]|nr:flippase [Lachnospiraceae bacterium]
MMKKLLDKLKGNRFLSNAMWDIGGKVFQMVLTLVVGMLTARYLGPSNYGVIGETASYVAFFSVICQLGFTSTAVKEIMDNEDKQGEILGTTIFFRICTSLISSVAIAVLLYVIKGGDKLIVTVAILQSLSLVFQSFDMIHYWYQSRLETQVSVKIQSVAYVIMAVYKIAILALGKSVEWFAFSTALEAAVVGAFLLFVYTRGDGQKLTISVSAGKEILKRSYHFILSGLMATIYSEMDKIMLGQMLNEESVGFYTAATKVSSMWSFVVMALINSSRPVIISSRSKGQDVYIKQNKRLYAAVIWIGIAAGLAITVLAKPIIYILYGLDYMPSVSSLQISAWYTMFSMLGSARGIWIVCEDKSKYVKYYLGIGAVLNVILNYLLIPVYGPGGAAAATLATQIFTAVFAPAIFKETRIYTKYVFEAFLLRGIR